MDKSYYKKWCSCLICRIKICGLRILTAYFFSQQNKQMRGRFYLLTVLQLLKSTAEKYDEDSEVMRNEIFASGVF